MAIAQQWEMMPDVARGDFIRSHARGQKPLSPAAMMELFCLTEPGLVLILQGQPWRPEYQASAKRMREATPADLGVEPAPSAPRENS